MAKYLSCTQPAPKTKFLYAANVVVMTASATKPLGKAAKKAFLVETLPEAQRTQGVESIT